MTKNEPGVDLASLPLFLTLTLRERGEHCNGEDRRGQQRDEGSAEEMREVTTGEERRAEESRERERRALQWRRQERPAEG